MPHFGRYNDDGIYFVSARSLAEGSGYRILSLPGEPHQTKYPPLYPLYLSAAWKLNPEFPANLPIVMALSWIVLPILTVLAWREYLRLGYGRMAAVLAGVLTLNPYSALFAISPLSELLGCALLLGCFLVTRQPNLPLLSGVLAGLAFLTKTAFAPVLPAVASYYLLKRRWRAAWEFTSGMLPMAAAWLWWSVRHRAPGGPTTTYYTDYPGFYLSTFSWGDLPARVSSNADVLCATVGSMLFYASETTQIPILVFRLLMLACLIGILRQVSRGALSPYHLFAVAYLPVLLLWNYAPSQRFVYPIYPLLLAGLATELAHFAGLLRTAWRKSEAVQRAVAAGLGLILIAFLGGSAWCAAYGLYYRLPYILEHDRALAPEMQATYRWIRTNIPKTAAFLAYDDPSLYLYTGRRACGLHAPPRGHSPEHRIAALRYFESMPDLARRNGYSYILLTRGDFLQDLSREDRARARTAIDGDAGSVTLYERNRVAVRRVDP